MDQRRSDRQHDVDVPEPVVAAGALEDLAAEPEAKLPAILKRPMSDSAHAPTAGGKPQSATTPGRCVAMKATWKPQTKNPAVSSRKLGSFHASRTACFIDFSGIAPCAASGC